MPDMKSAMAREHADTLATGTWFNCYLNLAALAVESNIDGD
jgi:hypothetical protein